METKSFDDLPDDLKKKIIESRKAFQLAANIHEELAKRFAILDLRVAATGAVVHISGTVDNEITRHNIRDHVAQLPEVERVEDSLSVVENRTTGAQGKEE